MVLCAHGNILAGVTEAQASGALSSRLAEDLSSGIHLFFALSGYLIAGPFIRALLQGRPLPSLREYLVRRGARILPAYWIALTAIIVLSHPRGLGWWQLLGHYLLIHNELPGQATAIYFVAWTLGIEVAFYLFVPIAAVVISRAVGGRSVSPSGLALGIAGLWVSSVAWMFVSGMIMPTPGPWSGMLRVTLPAFIGQFCPGMLVALAVAQTASDAPGLGWYRWLSRHSLVSLMITVAFAGTAAVAATSSSSSLADSRIALYAVASGAALLTVIHGPAFIDRIARVLAPIGLISYGIYLWHWVVVAALNSRHLSPATGVGVGALLVDIAVVVAITFPIAAASWLLVEQPLINAAQHWMRRRRQLAPATAAV
jgi:peptidoglycan/LPS O-acetylase OafA/YrhL